jgi:DNA mismatch repair protein MutL
MPALDFDLDASIQQLPSVQKPFTEEVKSAAASTSIYKGFTEKHQAHIIEPSRKTELRHWKDFYEPGVSSGAGSQESIVNSEEKTLKVETDSFQSLLALHHSRPDSHRDTIDESRITIQLHNSYILTETPNGFILINQQAAHERVLYEQLTAALQGKPIATQRSLFPVTFELTPADVAIMNEVITDLSQLGYLIEPFGKNSFVIQGTPADIETGNEKLIVESLLEQYKNFSSEVKFSKREKLIRSAARQQAIKTGNKLTEREMTQLKDDLFTCKQPNISPDGSPTYLEFKKDQLEKMFRR